MGNQCSSDESMVAAPADTPVGVQEANRMSHQGATSSLPNVRPAPVTHAPNRNPLKSSHDKHPASQDALFTSGDGVDEKGASSGCTSSALTTSLRSDDGIQSEMPAADSAAIVERELSICKEREGALRDSPSSRKKRRPKHPPPIVTPLALLPAMYTPSDDAMFVAVKEAPSRHCESVRLDMAQVSHDDSDDGREGHLQSNGDEPCDVRVSFASHAIVIEGGNTPARSQVRLPAPLVDLSPRQGALHSRMAFHDSSDSDDVHPKDEDCEAARDETNLFMSVAHYPQRSAGLGSSASFANTRISNGDSSHSFNASTSSGGVFVKIYEGPTGPGQYRHQLAKPKPSDRRSRRRAPNFSGANI